LIALLRRIADAEGAAIADDALSLITRAAEGSARDATSLLDQAISHGAGETGADQVRAMLGLADRGRVMDLFDQVMQGDAAAALTELGAQYSDGADPMAVLRDLAEITHWVSVIKITPEAADDPTIGPDERARGLAMADRLAMRILTRMWQMLLKALEEVAHAPNAMMAAEMAVIRLTHVADLPSPDELLRKLGDAPRPPMPGGGGGASSGPSSGGPSSGPSSATARVTAGGGGGAVALAPQLDTALARFAGFSQVVELIRANRDAKLLIDVETCLQLAEYSPGRIEFVPTDRAPRDLAARLAQRLQLWTGTRWAVTLVNEGGAPTIAALRDAEQDALKQQVTEHPLMQAVLLSFPKARITDIRSAKAIAAEAEADALPEVEDEWDPFEDD